MATGEARVNPTTRLSPKQFILLGRFFDRYAETVGENVRWIPFRLTGAELVRLADAYPVIERAEADLNRLYGEVLGYEPCEWQPGSYYAAIDAEVKRVQPLAHGAIMQRMAAGVVVQEDLLRLAKIRRKNGWLAPALRKRH